jgi:DnaJ family protein A protein 2
MGGRRGPPKEVDNSRLYDLIGVPKTATSDEIKKAFRKKAIREHPDKGGDAEKFKDLTVAYEILMNEDKRKAYDRYGEDSLKDGGAS